MSTHRFATSLCLGKLFAAGSLWCAQHNHSSCRCAGDRCTYLLLVTLLTAHVPYRLRMGCVPVHFRLRERAASWNTKPAASVVPQSQRKAAQGVRFNAFTRVVTSILPCLGATCCRNTSPDAAAHFHKTLTDAAYLQCCRGARSEHRAPLLA